MAIRPELRHELLTLSQEDRHELADELYESLIAEPLDPAWERAWAREIEQRVEDIVAGRAELIDADEAHAELRAELRDSCR
jgi:Putative addiction module component